MVAYERFKVRGTIVVYFEIFYIDSKSVVLTSLVFAGFQIAFVFPPLFQIFSFAILKMQHLIYYQKTNLYGAPGGQFFLLGFMPEYTQSNIKVFFSLHDVKEENTQTFSCSSFSLQSGLWPLLCRFAHFGKVRMAAVN